MSSAQDIPLIIDNNKQEQDVTGSEVMLTTFEGGTPTQKSNYDSIKEEPKILLPGDELMTRDEVPWYPTYVYVLYYFCMLVAPFIIAYLSYLYVEDADITEYLIGMISIAAISFFMGWFLGAIFYNLCGIPSNYTRKIGHLGIFLMPILLAGGIGAYIDDGGEAFGGFDDIDTSAAFRNIILDILWATWGSQVFVLVQSKPTRACSNYLCGDTRSKRKLRWFNCCEQTIDAFERKEDRPNHLLWINIQLVLWWLFLFLLSFWWEELDSGVQVLIPAFIGGLGDGLAEPVGVKFGKNCFGKDCTYRVHGCCTKHDYVRSVPGSSMVLLSGYLGVALASGDYTTWQFIIAMIVVPPVGCVVEAKAPHTLDNPFIALVVGVVATSILYIDL